MTGKHFREWRENHKWSTTEMGIILGYAKRQIERIEASNKPLSLRLRLACAAVDRHLPPLWHNIHTS